MRECAETDISLLVSPNSCWIAERENEALKERGARRRRAPRSCFIVKQPQFTVLSSLITVH